MSSILWTYAFLMLSILWTCATWILYWRLAYFDFSNHGNHLWRSRGTISLFFSRKL